MQHFPLATTAGFQCTLATMEDEPSVMEEEKGKEVIQKEQKRLLHEQIEELR